jgi:hypothetical protein
MTYAFKKESDSLSRHRDRSVFAHLSEAAVSRMNNGPDKSLGKRMLWFIALWLLGVTGTALLVLPFHLLVAAAMRR